MWAARSVLWFGGLWVMMMEVWSRLPATAAYVWDGRGDKPGDRRLFSEGMCCLLTCAFRPGHYPLKAWVGEIWGRTTLFSVKIPVCFFPPLTQALTDFSGAEARVWLHRRKLGWPKLLLMNRMCRCVFIKSHRLSLCFLPSSSPQSSLFLQSGMF